MYEDIGGKIQIVAKVIGWLCLIVGIVAFFVCITDSTEVPKYSEYGSIYGTKVVANTANDLLGWISLIAGVFGFCFSWVLYGFGELVDDIGSIRSSLTEIERITNKNQTAFQPTCSHAPKRPLNADSAPHMADN